MKTYRLSGEPYEMGAALLALLAYPEKDETKLENIQASLCWLFLGAKADADETWAVTPQLIKPIYAFRAESEVHRDWKPLPKRWRKRMVAARMAIAFLKAQVQGDAFQLPPGVARLSIHQLAEFVAEDAGQSDYKNVESRVWAPSKPVIHLAAAVAVAIDSIEKASAPDASSAHRAYFTHFLESRELLEWVVRTADSYAEILAKHPVRGIRPERLIRVVLA